MKCVVCQSEFTPNRCTHKHCSAKCYRRGTWRRQHGLPVADGENDGLRNCLNCGKEFFKTNRNWSGRCCSQSCSIKLWAKEHKDERKTYRKKWWLENRERILEQRRLK